MASDVARGQGWAWRWFLGGVFMGVLGGLGFYGLMSGLGQLLAVETFRLALVVMAVVPLVVLVVPVWRRAGYGLVAGAAVGVLLVASLVMAAFVWIAYAMMG